MQEIILKSIMNAIPVKSYDHFTFLCAFKQLILYFNVAVPPGDASSSSPAEFCGWLAVPQPHLQKQMLFL